ncbi:1640_t:CDS:2, partial [Ambispora leptoticha]
NMALVPQNTSLLNTFAQDFTELMKDESLYDLKIILPNGKIILGHKFCIMVRSMKFRKFFQKSDTITEAQMIEEIPLEKIVGSSFLSSQAISSAFEELFFYFYHDALNAGNWDIITANKENFLAFIQLVKILEMKHLVEPTLKKIEEYLSANNAVNLLNGIMKLIDSKLLIEENNLEDLYDEAAEKCIKFFENKDALHESDFSTFNMGNLSLGSFNYLMENIYSTNKNNIQETKKFLLAINWFNSKKSETAAKIQEDIFQNVEFPLIPPVTLATKISDIKKISPERYQDVLDAVVIQLANKCEQLEQAANEYMRTLEQRLQ